MAFLCNKCGHHDSLHAIHANIGCSSPGCSCDRLVPPGDIDLYGREIEDLPQMTSSVSDDCIPESVFGAALEALEAAAEFASAFENDNFALACEYLEKFRRSEHTFKLVNWGALNG